jgi:hypothetical protein
MYGTIFMLLVEDVKCIGRLWIFVFVVSAGGELAINAFQNLAGSEDSD